LGVYKGLDWYNATAAAARANLIANGWVVSDGGAE